MTDSRRQERGTDIHTMSEGLLKSLKKFAKNSARGGITVELSVSGREPVTIDQEAAKRMVRNVDAELARRKRRAKPWHHGNK